MQIELHVPNVRNAEIKGTVYRENPVSWICIWSHAMKPAQENILRDAAFCWQPWSGAPPLFPFHAFLFATFFQLQCWSVLC